MPLLLILFAVPLLLMTLLFHMIPALTRPELFFASRYSRNFAARRRDAVSCVDSASSFGVVPSLQSCWNSLPVWRSPRC